MNFKQTTDTDFLNWILNHDDVRAGGEIDIDAAPFLEHGIAYSYDYGAVIYVARGNGVFEAHTNAIKQGRGKILREFIQWTLQDMFNNQGAEKVTSFAYDSNPAAKKLAAEFLNQVGNLYEISKGEFLCH